MIKAAIIGGSGYVGGELIRFLLFHPKVKLVGVTSQSHTGEKIGNIHQNLNGVSNLLFEKEDVKRLSQKADLIFLALPHGQSMKKVKDINLDKTKVIDLGADFRLEDKFLFEKVYKVEHVSPDKLKKAVYGLPEIKQVEISKAGLVANPGCFPTGAILALYPLAKSGLLSGSVVINSATGSSGSGVKPSVVNHHSERAQDFRAYNVFSHRHKWEISQEIAKISKSSPEIIFTPHSASFVRGIFTTVYVSTVKHHSISEVKEIYQKIYENKPFIRLTDNPRVAVVAGTNYCDIGVFSDGKHIIVTSAIDNLVKGAAGQAVQNMNIMFGMRETVGLEFPGLHP
ncbi:N-acetyl-gamma-glutamyl-phosphate reductase [Patescibacteria group bacterium]|nr:N-acetyl-gamma-glutamyl-phosphate reductase [Patescibacteria group bacterium]